MYTYPSNQNNFKSNTEPEPVPYTLRIGITGHRILKDPDAVFDSVDRLFLQIKNSLENGMINLYQPQHSVTGKWQRIETIFNLNTKRFLASLGFLPKLTENSRRTPLKWKLISSLAKGADSIVSRCALEKMHAILEVVLPFDVNEYRKDFKAKEELEEFDQLYSLADCKSFLQNASITDYNSREDGYKQAGIAIVDACEILFAVWDGKASRGKGGTAEIIQYACSIKRPVIWINALEPELPAVMITSIQSSILVQEGNGIENISVNKKPLPVHATEWPTRYLLVAEYNRDNAFRKINFENNLKRNLSEFKHTVKKPDLFPEEINLSINKLIAHYTRSDLLAQSNYNLHTRSAAWLYRLAAIAVTVAVLQTLYFPSQTLWVLLEISSLCTALVWYRISVIHHWQEKWLNYRHLAERLRILLFHSLCVKQSNSPAVLSQQLPFYPGPEGWVVDVFEEIKKSIPKIDLAEDRMHDVKKIVLEGWITEQIKYHQDNAVQKQNSARKDNILIGAMLILTLVAAILHLLKLVENEFLENLIISTVIILPSFAAAQHAITSIHDYERIATRSVKMKEILQSLYININKVKTWEELSYEVQLAEDIMSAENHEWSVSLSFRRISLPV